MKTGITSLIATGSSSRRPRMSIVLLVLTVCLGVTIQVPGAGGADLRTAILQALRLAPDNTKPRVTSFSLPATSKTLQVSVLKLTATDNVGVTGYLLTESAAIPSVTQAGWSTGTPRSYIFSTPGTKTLYAWTKDRAGNVSDSRSAKVTITLPDSTPPVMTDFTMPDTATTLLVPVTTCTATDNVGITGYFVSESSAKPSSTAAGWIFPAPATHAFGSAGTKTVYAWAKDAAGNISNSLSATVTITLAPPNPTQLFAESFENNDFAARGWYDNSQQGTVVTGGVTGNCLQWEWLQNATQPTNGGAMRMRFPASESLFVSFYVKFSNGWIGSQQTYQPHMLYILSDLDDAASVYSPLGNNYLDTYIEFNSDIGAPYAIRPMLSIQDQKRVNTSYGTPPNDLIAVTEERSVGFCNTPPSWGAAGTCYADVPYYSAATWRAPEASLSINSWHHVEVYMKMNSINGDGKGQWDGIMQEWIDGVEVMDHHDVLYRTGQDATKKWAQFVLAPYIGVGSPIRQVMRIDELTVATDR